MCNKCDSLATFVLGALIGAALGVLYAPAKGDTTRRKLKRWAENTYEEGKEELADRAQELRKAVSQRTEDLKEKFSAQAAAAKERAGELKEKFSAKAEEFKQQALDRTEELRNRAADGLEKAAKKLR